MGKKSTKKAGPSTSAPINEEEEPPASKKAKLEDDKVEKSPEKDDDTKEEMGQAEKLQLLVSAFSSQQLDQYEIFRRATFQKSTVKKLMQSVSGGTVSQNVVIAMAGMAKVYVGEIVEAACEARDKMEETGPLKPKHIREAVRKLRQKNKIPNRHKKVLLWR